MPSHSSRFILAVLCVAALRCPASEKKIDSRPSAVPVILISIDTLRADHLPAWGYRELETPNLDRFRKDAILFSNAWSHSPMTLPSHLTMLTGLLPYEHGVRNNIGFRFHAESHTTLPQLLGREGYATGAAVSSYVLRGESGLRDCFQFYDDAINPRPGASFDEYQRPGAETAAVAQRWIDGQSSHPFFFFLHIYEPHVPYAPPEPYRSRYRSAYDGEIATADAVIGQFLDHLRSTGVYDRALIVITSDHGEGLGDHGEEQHSVLLYREALHVPLLVKLPRQTRGGEAVDRPVGLIDIVPTVIEVAGRTDSSPKSQARSLIDAYASNGSRSIYSETLYPLIHFGWSPLRSIIDDRYQYIESTRPELYDYRGDSGERKNVVADERRIAASMREQLASIPQGPIQVGDVDPEAAAKLSALGYIGSARSRTDTKGLPDPAAMIGTFEQIRRAFELADRQPSAGIAALRQLLVTNPAQFEVRVRLAEVLAREGRNEEAAQEYGEAIRRAPIFPADVAIASGNLLLGLGRIDEAEQHARSAMSDVPARAHELLARAALIKRDFKTAGAEAQAASVARPSAAALVLVAEVQEKSGAMSEALATLQKAEALAARQGQSKTFRLNFVRGDALGRMERLAEAERAYAREVEDFPNDLDAWAALALVKFLREDRTGMNETLDRMAKANPNRGAYLVAAKTLEALGEKEAARKWRAKAK